jgi:hypothetical protein
MSLGEWKLIDYYEDGDDLYHVHEDGTDWGSTYFGGDFYGCWKCNEPVPEEIKDVCLLAGVSLD